MGFAGRVKRPLSEIAIIDQITIGEIAELVIDNLPPGGYEHPATHPATMITEDTGHQFITSVQKNNIHAAGSDNQDISGKVDKETGKSLVADTEISKIHTSGSDNQDLSGLQPKETGKGLSTNDFTTADKSKLDGIENYVHPTNHGASIITQDASNRFVSDTEKGTWNSKEPGNLNIQTHVTSLHAPVNAQKNSDITKGEIESVLTGPISSHSHSGGADPFMAKLVLSTDKPTGANVTPVTLGLTFNYEANSKYVIDIYAIVSPTAATTGCGFLIDVSSVVTYVGTFTVHQLAATGTISGGSSIGDKGVTAMGVSSGMVGTNQNFVYGGALLITGANAGIAELFFRSETTAVTTCKANSVFRIMKI